MWERASKTSLPVRLATGILACLLIGYAAMTVALVAARFGTPHVLTALAILLLLSALVAAQCAWTYQTYGRHPAPWVRWLMFAAQAVLTYVPFAVFGGAWLRVPALLAGTALLLVPMPWAWAGYAAVVALQVGLGGWLGLAPAPLAQVIVLTAVTGLTVYGVVRLARIARELDLTRDRLARLAVTDEQERFRRDLHDLLGHRLTAVSLKCELAKRMLAEPDLIKVDEQLTEAIKVVQQAQSDVRAVAYGYPSGSLENELSGVRSMLDAAGVQCQIRVAERIAVHELPSHVNAALGAVLHEGVTNLLRHSFAQFCEIELGWDGEEIRLTVVNDGVRFEPHRHPGSGTGIVGMRERTVALGGRLTADPGDDGRFRLVARLPLEVRTPKQDDRDSSADAADPRDPH